MHKGLPVRGGGGDGYIVEILGEILATIFEESLEEILVETLEILTRILGANGGVSLKIKIKLHWSIGQSMVNG